MLTTLAFLPFTYWVFVLTVLFASARSAKQVRNGTGLPLLAVIFTVSVWYGLDVLYNDYVNNHYIKFDYWTLSIGWIQVSVFLLATLFFVSRFNRGYRSKRSQVYYLYQKGVNIESYQYTLNNFYRVSVYIWCFLVVLAFVAIGLQVIYFIFPFLGTRVNPFLRPRIGGGFSAVFALAQNLYVLVGCGFGLVAALATNGRIRRNAVVFCVLIWPYFILGRTRNTMLAVMLPAIIAYIFIRLRVSNVFRIVVLVGCFVLLNLWLLFVMDARNSGVSVSSSFSNASGTTVRVAKRHEGLNMYEELSWLNSMIADSSFAPNWGYRYYAEIANPIPRVFWQNKPTIGLDYAVARGQSFTVGGSAVTATISTGMIGQGVNNFGRIVGPLAAALVISMWVTALARLDTNENSFVRLPLVLIGLVLTFNMGRDITLLVVYPLVFGWLAIVYFERKDNRRRERFSSLRDYFKMVKAAEELQPGFNAPVKPRDPSSAVNAKNIEVAGDWLIRSSDCEIDVAQLETSASDKPEAALQPGFNAPVKPRDPGIAVNAKNNGVSGEWLIRSSDCEMDVAQLDASASDKLEAALQPRFKLPVKPRDLGSAVNNGVIDDWIIRSSECEIDVGQLEAGVATNSTTVEKHSNDEPISCRMVVLQQWSIVRSMPDRNGDILTSLAVGETVTKISQNGHWIEIQVDERPFVTGYIHHSTVAPKYA